MIQTMGLFDKINKQAIEELISKCTIKKLNNGIPYFILNENEGS